MTKSVAQPLVRKEFSVRAANAFRHHHRAETVLTDLSLHQRHEPFTVENNLGKQNHDGQFGALRRCQATGCGDPPGMPSHHLENENLG